MIVCNADLGHPCDANDGSPCARCAKWLAESEREHRRSWLAASPAERHPERAAREMREAGRDRSYSMAERGDIAQEQGR